MTMYHIEARMPTEHESSGHNFKSFFVKDKSYEGAIKKVAVHVGNDAAFTLVGVFESMEIDKTVHVRTQ